MNSSMLEQLKLYGPQFAPPGLITGLENFPIYHEAELYTQYGKFKGIIRGFIEDESSSNIVLATDESISFIHVNDVLLFSICGKIAETVKKLGFKMFS